MMPAPYYHKKSDGLLLSVKAKPATAKEKAVRVVDVGNDVLALEVSVNAAAQDGKANKALAERLAMLFGVTKSKVTLTSGQKSRQKQFYIEGDPDILSCKLEEIIHRSIS